MKYMIHTCNSRLWYVEQFLVPSMVEQGIKEKDIKVWLDKEEKGNLDAFMESARYCGKRKGGMWHLQDDVVISSDFAERTKDHMDAIQCGFCCKMFEQFADQTGKVISTYMWYSFPCIYIPNEIMGACADWFYYDVLRRGRYKELVREKKFDDEFFRRFIMQERTDTEVYNLVPNLVENIDYLIGGSVINGCRPGDVRAMYWEDPEAVEKLEKELSGLSSGPEKALE